MGTKNNEKIMIAITRTMLAVAFYLSTILLIINAAGCSSCSEVSPALALGGILTLFSFFIFRRKFL
jgi:hypothetical protein